MGVAGLTGAGLAAGSVGSAAVGAAAASLAASVDVDSDLVDFFVALVVLVALAGFSCSG